MLKTQAVTAHRIVVVGHRFLHQSPPSGTKRRQCFGMTTELVEHHSQIHSDIGTRTLLFDSAKVKERGLKLLGPKRAHPIEQLRLNQGLCIRYGGLLCKGRCDGKPPAEQHPQRPYLAKRPH